jgi:transposase
VGPPARRPARLAPQGRQARPRHRDHRRRHRPRLRRGRRHRPRPRRPQETGHQTHPDRGQGRRADGPPQRRGQRQHHTKIIPAAVNFPNVGGKPGRPKELPDKLYGDRGYDNEATRVLLRWFGIEPKIAKRRTPHGSGLGKVRWVVERTVSWIKGLRRMRVRYGRLGVVRDAWTTLAASVVCFHILTRDTL